MKYLTGAIIGGCIVMIICLVTMSVSYGRMSEHLECDRNVHIQDLERASNEYYSSLK